MRINKKTEHHDQTTQSHQHHATHVSELRILAYSSVVFRQVPNHAKLVLV